MDFRGNLTHPNRALWFHQRMSSSKYARRRKIRLDCILMIHDYWSTGVIRERLNGREYIRGTNRILRRHEETLGTVYAFAMAISISAKHSILSYPPLGDYSKSWSTRGSPEGRHGGALIQPSARMAVDGRWDGERSVIVGQARHSDSYQKFFMKIKKTPNKVRFQSQADVINKNGT